MLLKLNVIILYSLVAFFMSLVIYPFYIEFLKKIKAGKSIRESATTWDKAEIFCQLHSHKAGTPTMGGGLFLVVVLILVTFSFVLQEAGYINHSLVTREETYIILFWFFSMWILWLIDDYLNIKWVGKIKWLTAKMKLIWMFTFSAFISYFFYSRIWVDYINFWPFAGEVSLNLFYMFLTFIFTVMIVNAINITDWLDGLAWWLMIMILFVLWIITFFYGWFLATTVIGIVLGALLAFLWFNINPAKIFMWDSGALALWWFLASLIYLLNIKMWILFPFLILFWLFIIELMSSFLQIFWKKVFKRKLFAIAPYHHLLEHWWRTETNIVMKFWLVQWVLSWLTLLMIFYQLNM